LRLAAYLGHELAELAQRLAAISPPETPADTRSLASGLRHFEQSISVRAVVTIARSRLPAWERWSTTDRRPLLAIEAAESWLDCPCEPPGTTVRRGGACSTRSTGPRSGPIPRGGRGPVAVGVTASAATPTTVVEPASRGRFFVRRSHTTANRRP
jgi:hypothetical protein